MESLLDLIMEPLRFQFMQRALIAGLMVGAISGVVGAYVVVRGMSFFGDALAHSILPGVAVAFIFAGGGVIPIFIGGMVTGVISAVGIGWLTRDSRLKEDTAIGIVFVAMFALGIAIISGDSRAYGSDLVHILFGNILGIDPLDLQIMAVCGLIVLGAIFMFYKELMIISFDLSLARTLKLPSESLRILLLVLVAVTIVASLQIVGISLMLAMLVVPAATAQLFTRQLHHMMVWSAVIAMISSVLGIYISYHVDIATGPAIVLTVTAIFVVTFTVVQLWQAWGGRRVATAKVVRSFEAQSPSGHADHL